MTRLVCSKMMDYMMRPLGVRVSQLTTLGPMMEQWLGGAATGAIGPGAEALASAPLVVRVELLFPYTQGALFTLKLREHGQLEAVDAAFRTRLVSSLDDCLQLANSIPSSLVDGSPAKRRFGRHMVFFKCAQV